MTHFICKGASYNYDTRTLLSRLGPHIDLMCHASCRDALMQPWPVHVGLYTLLDTLAKVRHDAYLQV